MNPVMVRPPGRSLGVLGRRTAFQGRSATIGSGGPDGQYGTVTNRDGFRPGTAYRLPVPSEMPSEVAPGTVFMVGSSAVSCVLWRVVRELVRVSRLQVNRIRAYSFG